MAFVQTDSLPKLTCFSCKKYLSHFPIYSHPQIGSLCGRCTLSKEDFFENHIFEIAAQYLKFPCAYHKEGCLENLIPKDIPKHEKYCKYRKYDCPVKHYNNCIWTGVLEDLYKHFDNNHPTFILKDGRFEIDFINNHKENYILPYCDHLFIVTRQADSLLNTFSCKVVYVGCFPYVDEYFCQLDIESGNHAQKHSLSFNLNETLTLTGDGIGKLLNDPISIIAHLMIKEPQCDSENSQSDDDAFEHLQDLECPVCMNYMVPPIYQCIGGHSICDYCKKALKSDECPTCKREIKDTQNFVLENLTRRMDFPCRNRKCRFLGKPDQIKQHAETCIYGTFDCPLEEIEVCKEAIILTEMYDHLALKHCESLLEIDSVHMPFFDIDDCMAENIVEYYFIKYAYRLFRLGFMLKENTFYWEVQLIGGDKTEARKYKFEIDILHNNLKNKNRVYMKSVCSEFRKQDKSFNIGTDECIYLKFDQISHFISHQLSYRVRVLEE